MSITYKDAGVDIDKGDELVDRIKKMVRPTLGKRVRNGVGGFAALYEIGGGKLLAAGTDGVGTKLKIAQQLNVHDTIGIDLVAMCANDIICTGARPLFFLDYFATGKLDVDVGENLIKGIVDGCLQSEMALIGGETAEMPGLYQPGEYDLAGFAVGEVMESDLIDGSEAKTGDTLIGIGSSGVHSNAFSLVRKLINESEIDLLKEALTPTRIYVKLVNQLLAKHRKSIKGFAHITGSGFLNIPRINEKMDYEINYLPPFSEIPPIFKVLADRSKLSKEELYNTFNMGVGFVILTDNPKVIEQELLSLGEKFWMIGHVQEGRGELRGL